jgi:signal transduction histidine kinase
MRVSFRRSFATRLTATLALLLLGFGALVGILGRHVALEHEQEALQRLSHGLARHIVEHWPAVTAVNADAAERDARDELLKMLMVVNPGIQVYMLDADGRVAAYIGEPGMVREPQVDLVPVRAFLAGAALPLHGTDPMLPGVGKIFSAAMFAPQRNATRPPGYLYIVLNGQARELVAGDVSLRRVWQSAVAAAAAGLLIILSIGALVFRRLSQPVLRLAERMRRFSVAGDAATADAGAPVADGDDEVAAIAASFETMARRIEDQVRSQQQQAAAHREVMANVAHDLRTPLTALHGHLEALDGSDVAAANDPRRRRLLAAALAQSDKVRRLSQQLFELATLQSTDQVLQRERFRLDELVTDTVRKFELSAQHPPVTLEGPAPGRIELDGDLQLIERALTNLIDNALRHASGPEPVRVSMRCEGRQANVLIEDKGPGLPTELARRLDAGHPVRDPPLQRQGGGIGGLGLAIAQRIATLHGGSLRPLPAPDGGTRLCLALPWVRPEPDRAA